MSDPDNPIRRMFEVTKTEAISAQAIENARGIREINTKVDVLTLWAIVNTGLLGLILWRTW